MKNTSLAAGGAVVGASLFAPGMMKKAQAKSVDPEAKTEVKRTICSHCSVGCGIYAEVQNGVWTGQEPAFDHPFNAGGHCAKGAALREHVLASKPNPYRVAGHSYLEVETVPTINDFDAFFPYNDRGNLLAREQATKQNTVWGTGTHTHTPVNVFAWGPAETILPVSKIMCN